MCISLKFISEAASGYETYDAWINCQLYVR